jgi:hypothetical protein
MIGKTIIPTFSNIANRGATTALNADIALDNPSCPSFVLPNASLIAKNAATNKPTIPNDTVNPLPNVSTESFNPANPLPIAPIGPGNAANLSSICPDWKATFFCWSPKSSNLSANFWNSAVPSLPPSANSCKATVVSLICDLSDLNFGFIA